MKLSPDMMTREELEGEVTYLRGELGLITSASAMVAVKNATGLSEAPARALLALYRNKGRLTAKHQLLDAVPARGGVDERDPKMADVWVCLIRAATFPTVVQTVWGLGYAITTVGSELVTTALERADIRPGECA
jgi:DNA-binding response OmpR family regulator